MSALCTLEQIRTYLGTKPGDTGLDAAWTQLIPQASKAIENYLNRSLESGPRTEVRNGNGKQTLTLAHYPVTAVASVLVNGRSIPASVGYNSNGYWFMADSRVLRLRGYSFDIGEANIELAYTAGYSPASMPDDIKLACIQYCVIRQRERDKLGIGSKSLAGESVSYGDGGLGGGGPIGENESGMPPSVRGILSQYRNVVPETGL